MNPLDEVGGKLALSMMNPNVKARRRRDGPHYLMEVEIDQETFDLFMGAKETAGMVIEAQAEVTALNTPMQQTQPYVQRPGAVVPVSTPRWPGDSNSLAYRLHRDGYFRNYRLWRALHENAIYTVQEHKIWIESLPCLFHFIQKRALLDAGEVFKKIDVKDWGVLAASLGMQLACRGDTCLHHVPSAALPAAGADMQPENPRKVAHFFGVPLCMLGHHSDWVHSKDAKREEKEKLVEVAVALTAYRVKGAVKTYIGIESLRELTQEQLENFEREIGLRGE